MSKKLTEIFKRYEPEPRMRALMELALESSIRADREQKLIEATVRFPRIIDQHELYELEENIRAAYELRSVRILPKYDSSLYDERAIPGVLLEAERIGIVSRGFFGDYTFKIEPGRLTIDIPFADGGIELLCDAKTPQIISNIIHAWFDVSVEVTIKRRDGYVFDINEYEQRQNRYIDELIMEQNKNLPKSEPAPDKVESDPEKKELTRVSTLSSGDAALRLISDDVYEIGNMTFDVSGFELFYGEEFLIDPTPIREINSPKRNLTVLGQVLALESRQTRKGDKTIYSFGITDRDASISVKGVADNDEAERLLSGIFDGAVIALRANAKIDSFSGELVLAPLAAGKIKKLLRNDDYPEKRVELHLHTTLSTMDALIPPEEAVATAKRWGHRAVAITDHGNVQAFPIAMEAAEKAEMKVLYGMEAYFVDDTARAVFGDSSESLEGEFTVFDIETTGLSAITCKITEIGAVRIKNGEVIEKFNTFVNPECHIPENITELTHITDEMVAGAPKEREAVEKFLEFAGNTTLIAHNALFDTGFIRRVCEENKLDFKLPFLDTVAMSRYANPELKSHKLDTLANYFKLGDFDHHRACDDAYMLALIFFKMAEKLMKEGVNSLADMNKAMSDRSDPLRLKSYHMIIFAKNQVGLKNLYKLVSASYLDYYRKVPRIPKTVLERYREGLIIGSACEAGELFTAVLGGRSQSELREIASFYDYLEIQPLCNNRFLIDNGTVSSDEDLMELNRRIVRLGGELGKPVVATCDCHFLDKCDEIGRKILLSGLKFSDADRDCGLYFRTTGEMMEEFMYLGEEKAREVVITNTNLIADMIEEIRPIPKGTFTPHMDGAEEQLTEMCHKRARSMYGDPLPEIVDARLEKELDSIIKHGFAVLYMIAQKLVGYSESQGYLVGSRGSVGSSFVASMAGISEVNPLPPHYWCPGCQYSEFFTDGSVGSGFDLPDKLCPKCGEKLKADGHDIPFETFLGFYGDKSPDIDLNFSGEVQGRVHKYTEELFGSENVFRAGTLGTLADKTAYGFVMKYLENKGISVSSAEVNRLVNACVGVKRTTGQHPGGIIVVPREYEVYDFTPVQHPADDPDSNIITTHFAFSYLHDTILKLDELGHDVPTKYKAIERFTNTSVMDVPMNDQAVYELFRSTKSLGASPEEIGSEIGTFGLPEFGTGFVQPVVIESKPKNFADLLQISGLTHGTDVWLGNAQDLIRNGICDISKVVGTRDGIMLDLIRYGLDKGMAFKIMEMVRKNKKGKPIPDDMLAAMREKNVPEWYIDSLAKIKYMFPKAHAAAYVMSAIRIGWYKVHMPLEFYCAFFTVAPKGLESDLILAGKRAVAMKIAEITDKSVESSQKDANMLGTLQLVNEAYARGIKFLPVELYKSDASAFLPEDGRIRLPFSSLPGVGDKAAQKLCEVCKEGEIKSVEDLKIRSGLSKSVFEILQKNGVLDKLSETNQLTLF